jgi:hypothetical protein
LERIFGNSVGLLRYARLGSSRRISAQHGLQHANVGSDTTRYVKWQLFLVTSRRSYFHGSGTGLNETQDEFDAILGRIVVPSSSSPASKTVTLFQPLLFHGEV